MYLVFSLGQIPRTVNVKLNLGGGYVMIFICIDELP